MNEQELNKKYPGRTVHREGDHVIVTIPVNFRRRNGRKMFVAAPNGGSDKSQNDSKENEAMIAAIAKAWAWQEEFESGLATGQYASLEDFAKEKRRRPLLRGANTKTDFAFPRSGQRHSGNPASSDVKAVGRGRLATGVSAIHSANLCLTMETAKQRRTMNSNRRSDDLTKVRRSFCPSRIRDALFSTRSARPAFGGL